MEDTSQGSSKLDLDSLIPDIDKEHELLKHFIKNMDMDELGVTIFPTPKEWLSIQLYRHGDITKELVLRCKLPIEHNMELFTLEEFLENTTSKHLYYILTKYTKIDVIKAIDYYKNSEKFDITDIIANTECLPYVTILKYWEDIEKSEDALSSLCGNLFVPNAFFIQHKELFWKYRWGIGRRILDSKLCKAFKLVPYRCIPEEYERFHIIESRYDNEMTTKEALKALKGDTLPLEDFLD